MTGLQILLIVLVAMTFLPGCGLLGNALIRGETLSSH